jgi:coronin-7
MSFSFRLVSDFCFCFLQIARMLKLHADRLEPVRFIVPRQRKEYFQDDLFGATRSVSESSVQAQAWLGGAEAQLKYDNLCPKVH